MPLSESLKKLIFTDERLESHADFSRKAGIPESTLSTLITGKVEYPNLKTLKKIATYFNCEIEDLVKLKKNRYVSTLSKKLSQLLLEKKVYCSGVSKETGIGYSRLYAMLNKPNYSPKPQTLEKLAKYFDVPVSYFTEEDEEGDKK